MDSWVSSLETPRQDQNRSKGLHLSHILNLFDGSKDDEEFDETSGLRINIGFAVEDLIGSLVADTHHHIYYHPPEFKKDGIALSPDALIFANKLDSKRKPQAIGEFKTTGKDLDHYDFTKTTYLLPYRWIMQIMSYCVAVNVQRCELVILHLRSQFAKGFWGSGPLLRQITLKFDKEDLDRWWKVILNGRDILEGKKTVIDPQNFFKGIS